MAPRRSAFKDEIRDILWTIPIVSVIIFLTFVSAHFFSCNSGKNIRKDIVENKAIEQLTNQTLIFKMMKIDTLIAREFFCFQTMTAKGSDAIAQCEKIGNILNSRAIKKDCSTDGKLGQACVDLYFRRK